MPRVYEMSWDSQQSRWVKMYKGKRYFVAASVLGAPPSREGSREAANRWWREKKLEIDSANLPAPREPMPLEDLATASLASKGYDLVRLASIAQQDFVAARLRRLAPLLSPEIRAAVEALFDADNEPAPEFIGRVIQGEIVPLIASTVANGEPLPDGIAGQLPPARVQQVEAGVQTIRGKNTVPPAQTIKAHSQAWLDVQQQFVTIGDMTAKRYDVVCRQVNTFLDFAGSSSGVAAIDAASIQGFYQRSLAKIAEGTWSRPYAREMFATVRRFVRWLAEQGTIPLPPNIASRSFRFGTSAPIIQTWTAAEVQHVLGNASERTRLYLHLMLNVGATQQDISDLKDSEIDWTAGRVTRKRSKMKGKDKTPLVCYPLWPEAFRLLQQFRSGGETVLLTEKGGTLLRQELHKGKLRRSDMIAANYQQLQKRLDFKKSLKQLRKTGASLLAEHPEHSRFVQHYLGHAPATMADRHYTKIPQKLFDAAVMWLGQQFGFVEPADAPENHTS